MTRLQTEIAGRRRRTWVVWLYFVDGVALTRWDVAGAAIALVGMTVIALQPATGA